jgi:molecular chaperone DnaK (HSP70)
MSVKQTERFVGIDLGTTNTRAQWGREGNNNTLVLYDIDMDMFNEEGGEKVDHVLPSFVYFPYNEPPIIGPRAKKMMESQPSLVIRSIKTSMGKEWEKTIGKQKLTPAIVSSLILKEIAKGIKKTLNQDIKNVVITVPASFDIDQREETIKAAKLTGFDAQLLDEPRACLYDYVNRIRSGAIAESVIDFSKEKIVLVYDFGGGTLDISMHKVQFKNPKDFIVAVEDMAISRYTDLGGDKFDERLADHLFQRYLLQYKLKEANLDKFEVESEKTRLFLFAEQYKKQITGKIKQYRDADEEVDYSEIKAKINPGLLFDQHPLSIELSYADYMKLMADYLGVDLKYPTEATINQHIGEHNLISPILDVLRKVYQKENRIVKPDLILLSGGMTRLQMVQERLEKFFAVRPISISDPDMAVSRGASIFHYYLAKGYKPNPILSDPIYLKVVDDKHETKSKCLVDAGVVLPKEASFSFLLTDPSHMKVWFYKDAEMKYKLAERRFTLTKAYPIGTSIMTKIRVDENKIATFDARVKENLTEKVTMAIDTKVIVPEFPAPKPTTQKPLAQKQAAPVVTTPVKVTPRHITKNEVERLFERVPTTNSVDFSVVSWTDLVNAKNFPEIVRYIIGHFRTKGMEPKKKDRMIILLGDFASTPELWKQYPKSMFDIQNTMAFYVKYIANLPEPKDKEIHGGVRYAIETIGKTALIDKERTIIAHLKRWEREIALYKIRFAVLYSIGKMIPVDSELLQFLVELLDKGHKKDTIIPLFWSIGKQSTREAEIPVPVSYIEDCHEKIMSKMNLPDYTTDFEVIRYGAFALLEISIPCEKNPKNCYSDEKRSKVIAFLESKRDELGKKMQQSNKMLLDSDKMREYSRYLQTSQFLNFAISLLKKEKVSSEDMELLREIREKN